MSELAGKIALITGANRGIGRAIALAMAEAGADVCLTARDESLLQHVAEEVRELRRTALIHAGDLREPDTASHVVESAVARFGKLDILVNNAGATVRGDFRELTDEQWTDGFALKFFGAMRLCRAAWPHLEKQQGSIVNISGIGGRTPGPEFAIGGSVNAAMLAMTKSLADRGTACGVQVNAINPGSVWTDRLHKRVQAYAERHGLDLDTAAAELQKESKVTRFGQPVDVANLVVFLVSEKGRWLQGSLIDIDGGQTKTI